MKTTFEEIKAKLEHGEENIRKHLLKYNIFKARLKKSD